jgi:hypothetical protein
MSLHHSFDIDCAKKYGVEKACILSNIYKWNKYFVDRKELHILFPYIEKNHFENLLTSLIKEGLLSIGEAK